MKFTLNYLMIKRLGELIGLEYNDISPMNEIAPDTEELIKGLPADILSETVARERTPFMRISAVSNTQTPVRKNTAHMPRRSLNPIFIRWHR